MQNLTHTVTFIEVIAQLSLKELEEQAIPRISTSPLSAISALLHLAANVPLDTLEHTDTKVAAGRGMLVCLVRCICLRDTGRLGNSSVAISAVHRAAVDNGVGHTWTT